MQGEHREEEGRIIISFRKKFLFRSFLAILSLCLYTMFALYHIKTFFPGKITVKPGN